MSNYAVGDIQGCLEPLKKLLNKVSFDPKKDTLWSVGDLVNRGPQSLEALRFCYNLGSSFRMVLGNHDLHLLATANGFQKPSRNDTLDDILAAPDRDELLHWLQQQPLMLEVKGHALVHAGIPPQWSLNKARKLAEEMSDVLRCDNRAIEFFKVMYGNEPNVWEKNLSPPLRWRLITNYFTRMRFCSSEGHLELTCKNLPEEPPKGFSPWFEHENRRTRKNNIIFGHWAALAGSYCGENLFPLDTGYIWGGPMRLMNIKTKKCYHQYK